MVVQVDRAGYERLVAEGFWLEIDAHLTAQLNQPHLRLPGQVTGIPGYPCYRTVEETFDTAQDIVAAHPDLATWTDVGDSWEKTINPDDGYDLMVLRLTNAAIPGPKPKLFIMTAVHAREYTTAELNTRFAEYLVDNYGTDPDVTWLLDYHEMHLLLQANPDGRKRAETGLLWRKNTNNNYCAGTNNRGADLNRNFEFQWGCCNGSSGDECAETYRGPGPASEPETQAIQNYVRAQFPDQREDDLAAAAPITATGVFIDIHSYSELVLWPWGFEATLAPNSTALQTLGRKLAYFNGYAPDQAVGLYPTDGTTDDFAYGDLGLAAYTFELGTSFFQDCDSFENTILPDNLLALIYAAKAARTPYLTPAGPDALDVAFSTTGVAPGEVVSLTAVLNDTRYNNENGTEPTQDIDAAEYYIDVPPWITTTTSISYPMTAADGAFDQTSEAVEANVDTSSLPPGRHIVFVRGQDADGNWGVFSSAFLYVLDPGVSPTIEGYVREIGADTPLSATVTAGAFQTQTHPLTGYYRMMVISDTYNLSAIAPGYAVSATAGVQAHDYQAVRQDFYLYPVCEIWSDDVEAGNQGWTAEGQWAITTEDAHSPSHSWTDSPGGNYGSRWNDSLTSPVFDLSDYRDVTLNFWHVYDIEQGWDYGHVEYAINGSEWEPVAAYSDEDQTAWRQETLSLSALDGQTNARFRFRLDTDDYVAEDGWHIDDVALMGGGPACTAPLVAFSSNSPVVLGNSLVLTNTTTGREPLSYLWDFGDGVGTSAEHSPQYTYTSTGTFTVTLTATNSRGSASASQLVAVISPTYGVALTPTTAAQSGAWGARVTYALTLTNQGNSPDRYWLETSDNTWTTTLSITATDELLPQESTALQVTVDVPLGVSVGQSDTVTVSARSQNAPSLSSSSTLTTTVFVFYGLTLQPSTDAQMGEAGATVTYTLWLTNDGNVPDAFSLSVTGQIWTTTVSSSVGPLSAGAGADVPVTVHIPPGVDDGAQDRVTVGAASQGSASISASSILTTTASVLVYDVNLAPSQAAAWGEAGATVTYTLRLTNTGDVADTFALSATGETWTTTVPSSVGPLGAGAGANVPVTVHIPPGVSHGAEDSVTISAISQSDPLAHDESVLTTMAIVLVYGVELTASSDGESGPAGGSVTFTLAVRNLGTVADDFDVNLSGNAWNTISSTGTIGLLAPNATATLEVYVTIPLSATAGMTDTVQVTLTSLGDPGQSASLTLTTTAVWWHRLYLPLILES
jgi:uncharacterized membrane protein